MNETISSEHKNKTQRKYVSYREGAEMYSLGLNTFQKLAHEADACFKIGKKVIVNCEMVEFYKNQYRLEQWTKLIHDSNGRERKTNAGLLHGRSSGG